MAFGKKVFHEFNFHKWVEIRKGKIFYKGYVKDENGNTIAYTPLFEDFDDCLNYTRDLVDHPYLTDEEMKRINVMG